MNFKVSGEVTIEKDENGEESWEEYEEDIMSHTEYNGRIWTNRKVISFWKMPRDRFELKDIVDDLNNESGGRFHIDGSWKIRIGEYLGKSDKLITLSNFSGGEISDEEKADLSDKWKAHIMSPLLKAQLGLNKVPAGYGSKNPTYSRHRAIDRAVGRAQ
jgi:hypothetical protein